MRNRCIAAALVWAWSAFGDTAKVPTFSNEIARVFQNRCQECHRPGGVAPMSMVTYKETRPWAKAIKEKVAQREMPPFHATGPIGRYVNDPRLTDEEIRLVSAWVDGNSPEGNPKDLPAPRSWPEGWLGGTPDVVLSMKQPYTLKTGGKDDYEYFFLDYVFPDDTYMRGIEIRPGNRRAVHHANVHVVPPSFVVPESGNISGMSMVGTFLTGWAPGAAIRLLPVGFAAMIPKGTRLALQMHYAPAKEPITDQTSIGLYFADGHITHRNGTLHGGTRNIRIPAGDPGYRIIEKRTFPADALVRQFTAHMHLRGKSFQVLLHYPDGRSEVAFDVPRYDFNWQRTYQLVEPIPVPKGTVAEYIAIWDNSPNNRFNPDPNQVVTWGENTTDEMMGGHLGIELLGQKVDFWVKKGRRASAPETDPGR